jgi:hypothetical protein
MTTRTKSHLDTIQRCEGWYPGDEGIIEMAKIVGGELFQRQSHRILCAACKWG